jgi:predicted HNH restriction endonuclease
MRTKSQDRYHDLLKDPRWQKKRLEVLELSGWKCSACGDSKEQLHVHHWDYVYGRKPWEYDVDGELSVLCDTCHKLQHMDKRKVALYAVVCLGFDYKESIFKCYPAIGVDHDKD